MRLEKIAWNVGLLLFLFCPVYLNIQRGMFGFSLLMKHQFISQAWNQLVLFRRTWEYPTKEVIFFMWYTG